jgi:hypothetical protein
VTSSSPTNSEGRSRAIQNLGRKRLKQSCTQTTEIPLNQSKHHTKLGDVTEAKIPTIRVNLITAPIAEF